MTPLLAFILKLLAGAGASLFVGGTLRGVLWLREVKTNHLPHLQAAMEAIPVALDKQTHTIVASLDGVRDELKEQRADIRTVIMKL